jgi:peptidyl-prolyl cis-trans isomerase SurA
MKRFVRSRIVALAALTVLLAVFAAPRARAEIVDRIIAAVNGHVILQSDWDEALSYEALLNDRPISGFSDDERRAVLDRLIDQELLAEQMKSSYFQPATEAEAEAVVADARKKYPEAATDEGWQSVLSRFHLTQKELQAHVRRQLDVMRLCDAHLRPAVQIDSKSIEAYYREKFMPELKQSGANEVPLADVSGKIRELLTEEKVNELLVSWLQTLRSESKVSMPGVANPTPEGEQAR